MVANLVVALRALWQVLRLRTGARACRDNGMIVRAYYTADNARRATAEQAIMRRSRATLGYAGGQSRP